MGRGESVLRLLPLFCGLLVVFLTAHIARLYIDRSSVLLAIALVALNPSLIYYSSEVKQYSSDALVTVLLLRMFVSLAQSDLSAKKIFAFGFMGAAAVWFSHPAAFLLSSAAVVFPVSTRTERQRFIRLALVVAMWAAGFLILYFVSLRHLANDSALLDFWSQYFPPRGFAHTVGWLFDVFAASFRDPAGLAVIPGMAFFVVGIAVLFRRNRQLGWIVCGSCVATLLAAFAHRYPLGGRLLLFAVPIILFVVAEGVAAVCARCPRGRLVHAVVACLVLALPVLNAIRGGARSISGIQRDDIRPVLEYVNAHASPTDGGYAYFQAQPQMRYYSDVLGIRVKWKLGSDCGADAGCYAKDVNSLAGTGRTWIILSHVLIRDKSDDRAILLEELDKRGRRLEEFSTHSAHAYLYDLGGDKR